MIKLYVSYVFTTEEGLINFSSCVITQDAMPNCIEDFEVIELFIEHEIKERGYKPSKPPTIIYFTKI